MEQSFDSIAATPGRLPLALRVGARIPAFVSAIPPVGGQAQ